MRIFRLKRAGITQGEVAKLAEMTAAGLSQFLLGRRYRTDPKAWERVFDRVSDAVEILESR